MGCRCSHIAILVAGMLLAGCAQDRSLRVFSQQGFGPDEFLVLLNKPLRMPEDLRILPEPSAIAGNLADPTPRQDAVRALGGGGRDSEGAVPVGADLLAYSQRYGSAENIRALLAAEDADFRRRRGRFGHIRLARTDRYNPLYRRFHLDAYAELERWQQAGVRTPAPPPRP